MPTSRTMIFRRVGVMALFCALVACGASNDQTAGERFRDALLANNVRNHLEDHPRLRLFEIRVSAENGVVILSGVVDSQENRSEAADLVRSVSGVKSVVNNLLIR